MQATISSSHSNSSNGNLQDLSFEVSRGIASDDGANSAIDDDVLTRYAQNEDPDDEAACLVSSDHTAATYENGLPGLDTCQVGRYVTLDLGQHLRRQYRSLFQSGVNAQNEEVEIRRRLFVYFKRSTFIDGDNHGVVIPHTTIQKMIDVNVRNHSIKTSDYLEDFRHTVFPLQITDPKYKQAKARTVRMEMPEELERRFRESDIQLLTAPCTSRIDLITGKRVSHEKWRRLTKKDEEAAIALAESSTAASTSSGIMRFLNYQSERVFKKYVRRNAEAVLRAMRMMPQSTESAIRRHAHTERVYLQMAVTPKPIYRVAKHSARLYAIGASSSQLPRMMRKLHFEGATSLDLRSAQLAIVASLWNLDVTREFLETGNSVWDALLSGADLMSNRKPLIKETLYGIIFGMDLHNVRRRLLSGGKYGLEMHRDQVDAFLSHPMIEELIGRRQDQYDLVNSNEGVEDPYGQLISNSGLRARQVLAIQAQSYEFYLMEAALPIFKAHKKNATLLSWLHDGITFDHSDGGRIQTVTRQLQNAVLKRAQERNIMTVLELDTTQVHCDAEGTLFTISTDRETQRYEWPM